MNRFMYCIPCDRWTLPEPTEPDDPAPHICGRCGEVYQCGECGFEVDRDGNCQREHVTGDHCPSTDPEPLCHHGMALWLCADPINHYPSDRSY